MSINILSEDIARMLYGRVEGAVGENIPVREAFSRLRAVFDYAVKAMLEGDIRVFGTQYSRLVYLCSKSGADAGLTRLALAFGRKAAGFDEKAESDSEELRMAASTLVAVLEGFSGLEPPEGDLAVLRERVPMYGRGEESQRDVREGQRHMVAACVMNVLPVREEDGKRYYVIEALCRQDERWSEDNMVRVTVAESYPTGAVRADLMRLRGLLRPFGWVHMTDLAEGTSRGVLHTTESSLVVVEPDYLVDVTDIAGCFGAAAANPNVFLLSRLSPERDSEAMLKGTLINDLLDAFLTDGQGDTEGIFRKALSKNLLKAARYGGEAVRRIWDSVLEEHAGNIAAFARSLEGERVSVEPSFLSAFYGMQGRLDILTDRGDDALLKNIYELKSGRAPGGTALWRGHQIQVTCYDMLLSSVYGEDRRGTSALFYSGAQGNPLRNFLSSPSDRQQIVEARNGIVARVFRLAEEDYAPLDDLTPERFGERPSYLEDALQDFAAFYGRLGKVKKKYYQAYLSFSLREMIAAKTGAFTAAGREGSLGRGYSSLWLDSPEQKREQFAVVDSLEFEWFDRREHLLYFAIRNPVEHTLRSGDVAVLYPFTGGRGDALRHQVVKGTVREVTSERLSFSPRGAQVDVSFFGAFARWAVEHDMMEKGYWSAVALLPEFLGGESAAAGAAFGTLAPGVEPVDYTPDVRLTDNQNEAVRAALAARDYFLLQGPPGTGKTSGALMGIVRNVLENTGDNLVLMAFTNRAVQEIGDKLKKAGIAFLRLGHEGASGMDRTLTKAAEGLKVNGLKDFLVSQRVILATVSAFSSRLDDLKELVRFDVAVVDEASQLTEVQLAGVLARFRKFILVGDQKQLPAVTAQDGRLSRVEDRDLQKIGLYDLRGSLFERLWDLSRKKGFTGVRAMLDTHFRMHRDIAELVNPFYGGALRVGTERQQVQRGRPRLRFIPSGLEPTFKFHLGEAKRVAELVREIAERYGKKFSADTVGVVTPWRAQIAVIRSAIGDESLLEKVTVDTVERFQGGEKEVIIVSMAVSSPLQMAMLESVDAGGQVDRKLNVTLSRAREELILLGYEPALVSSPFYARVLEAMTGK